MENRRRVVLRRRREREPLLGVGGAILAPRVQLPESAIAEAVAAERERILRWLHDSPLQALEYIAGGGWNDGERTDAHGLARVAALAADDLRRFILGHHGAPEGASLVEGVDGVIAEASRHATQRIELVRGPSDGSLTAPVRQALLGALREALTNARKHSGAERVLVYCEEEDAHAAVTIRDEGVGAGLHELYSGFGVRHSIIERMRAAGGWARLEQVAEGGIVVRLGVDA